MDDIPTDVMLHPQATTVGTTVEEGMDDAMILEGFERVFHMSGVPSETRTLSSDSSDACPLSGVSVDSNEVCPVSGVGDPLPFQEDWLDSYIDRTGYDAGVMKQPSLKRTSRRLCFLLRWGAP